MTQIISIFVVLCIILNCSGFPESDKGKTTGGGKGKCAGVDCVPPPKGATCKKDEEGREKTGQAACCPDLECTMEDGSVVKHEGYSVNGSKGSSYAYGDPSSGNSGSGSTSSFSSFKKFSTKKTG